MSLRSLHRLCAAFLGLFLIAHLGNHLLIWFGDAAHIAVMETLRVIYRAPVVEAVLLITLVVQMGLGIALIRKRGRPDTGWAWAQVLSGGYLVFFLLQHVPAVLYGRWILGVDTNIYYAAKTVEAAPLSFYFAPYYAFAVMAVFTHFAAAWRFAIWPRPARGLVALPLLGLVLGIGIVVAMMQLQIPDTY